MSSAFLSSIAHFVVGHDALFGIGRCGRERASVQIGYFYSWEELLTD